MKKTGGILWIAIFVFCGIGTLGIVHKENNLLAEMIGNQKKIPLNLLVIQDTLINSTLTGSGDIMVIRPTSAVSVIFKNNRISANNTNEHIVLFGGEQTSPSDHMLDGITIAGNKIEWTGSDLTDSDEGLLIGYCVNATIRYNLIRNCPYGTPTKSDGFTYTSGGVSYNVYGPSFKVGTGAKGTNGVRFCNNTFYNNRNIGEGVVGSVYINSNNDIPSKPASTNCRIFNNLFYTRHQIPNIYCDNPSLPGLQCDYNVYYCEDGEPVFKIGGNTITLMQWKAMGHDRHSVVVNPDFTDPDRLIPSKPLNYGKNLGATFEYGLDSETRWNGSDPILKPQGPIWQVGAFVK